MKNLSWIILLMFSTEVCTKVRNSNDVLLARQKRFLIFADGVNWVQMVIGIGFPVELRRESVTWGVTVKSWYLLPTNTSDYFNPPPPIAVSRKTRSISRWKIYNSIKDFIDRFKVGNGKSCLLRAICEAALFPLEEKSGLLAEILHLILTPSSTKENVNEYSDIEYHAAENLGRNVQNCKMLFPHCNFYLLEQFSKLFM